MAYLLPGERPDDLQLAGLRLIQRPSAFCLSTDSVLLADFAGPRRGDHIADLGCGNGAIAILLAGHQAEAVIEAIELQPELAEQAYRSVLLNSLEQRVHVHCADMRTAWQLLGRESCSLAVCNPPYLAEGEGPQRADRGERIARSSLAPEEVAAAAAALLKYGGRFCVCFPARRGLEMLDALRASALEPKRLRCVQARADRAPRLLLIEAVKGGKRGLDWLPPLILYDSDGSKSAEWCRIYGNDS